MPEPCSKRPPLVSRYFFLFSFTPSSRSPSPFPGHAAQLAKLRAEEAAIVAAAAANASLSPRYSEGPPTLAPKAQPKKSPFEDDLEGDNAKMMVDVEEEDEGGSFIDDSEATHVAPGYETETDDEGPPVRRRNNNRAKRMKTLAEDEGESGYEGSVSGASDDDLLQAASNKVRHSVITSEWGPVVDLRREKSSGAKKLKDRNIIGNRYVSDGDHFAWFESRTLESANGRKFKKPKKCGKRGYNSNEVINVILAREYEKKESSEKALFEFNIQARHIKGVLWALGRVVEDMKRDGYLADDEEDDEGVAE